MINWEESWLILPVIVFFLAWYIYYLCFNQGTYLYNFIIVTDTIRILIVKIKILIDNFWLELKRNKDALLKSVCTLAIITIPKFSSRGANIWNVFWLAGIATLAILCYCYKLFVQIKRAQLTPTWMIKKKNIFFIVMPVLEFILFLACLLLAFAYFRELDPQSHQTGNDWKTFASIMQKIIDIISVLLPVIGACAVLIRNIEPNEFRRNKDAFLEYVYTIALIALAKFSSRGANIWNVWWLASIATLAILCYCYKLCVRIKRAQLTGTLMNNKKNWFSIVTPVLEFILIVAYLLLAFAYVRELDPQNHYTGNDRKMVASVIKKIIDILSGMLAAIGACEVLIRIIEPDEVPQLQTNNNIPPNLGETMSAVVPQRDVENQFAADANVAAVVHMDVENKYAADVAGAVQWDVENQSAADADPPGVAVQIDDAENFLYAGADLPQVELQMDAENQSVADADPPKVAVQIDDEENQSYAGANLPEVALQMDAENQPLANAGPPGEAVQIDDVENQSYAAAIRPEAALKMDGGNHSVAYAIVGTDL